MKRKSMILLALLLVLFSLVPSAGALDRVFVTDNAGLLSAEEEEWLIHSATAISESYGIDAAVLTVDSLEGTAAQAYADDFYDRNGYAEDGLLFLVAMEEREWYITTCGKAVYAFTDYGLMQLEERILPNLSDGDYYSAFDVYMKQIPDYMDAYLSGAPIDGTADSYGSVYHDDVVYYETRRSLGNIVLVSMFIGLIVAGTAILLMRAAMNTKRAQRSAGDYLSQGSFHLHTHRDIYLYSSISKVRRQQNSGSSSGGSSVHRSSGGRSHGGRGGKF